MFYVIPKHALPLNTVCQMSAPFQRKKGRSFEGSAHQIFHFKRGYANSREALFSIIGALSSKYGT